MLKNYLKVVWRNIKRHKGYSFINIAGLAIGLACCLLICIWVLDELSYDKFHENASNLYRVEENQFYSGRTYHVTVTPYPLAPALVEEIPEIIDAARYVWAGGRLFRYGEQAFYENSVRAVDPSFLKMMSFPLIRGNPDTALDSPFSLILSRDQAGKYFGNENPIGKVITADNQHELTVTGVMENIPHNSSLQFDMLVAYELLERLGATNPSFGTNSITTLVQLQDGVPMEQVNPKIKGFIKERVPETTTELMLMPYTRLHLHAYWGYKNDPGAVQYVYIFSIIAAFVLLIACINFMNLSTARSANRAREVGLRKVVGAAKSHLIRQFYGESIIFALIAMVFAAGITTLLLPAFSTLSGKELSWTVAGAGTLAGGLLLIVIITGLAAGSYPALLLSSLQPARVLKGRTGTSTGSARFRKILVVVQFSLSILLIIGTVVVYKQLKYMRSRDLGWNSEHLIYASLPREAGDVYTPLKQALKQDPRVMQVSAASHLPSSIGSNSSGVDWEGKDPDLRVLIGQTYVDYDYVPASGIEIKEGRHFSPEYPSDVRNGFLVNEETAALMEKESVVGERFQFGGIDGKIVGVMKNFHYSSMRTKIEPLAVILAPDNVQFLLIRIPPHDISGSVDFIQKTWKKIIPNYPLEYHFIDENFDRMYRSESRMGTLLNVFAVLAVVIACLGLFGLASYTAEQRTREIGIRKVLGAGVPRILVLITRDFFLLVFLANLIAWPAAYLIMTSWLKGYAYRTNLNIGLFAAAMGIALLVAVISVGYQSFRAATRNPADAIRYE
ncbi:MAG: ABC transporter permease [Candidatus Aminicenantes bacterium]